MLRWPRFTPTNPLNFAQTHHPAPLSEESASSGEDDFDFEDFYRRSSGSGSEEGSSYYQGEGDFRHELKEWAISTNTPLSHVSSLLSVLRTKGWPHSPVNPYSFRCNVKSWGGYAFWCGNGCLEPNK